LSIIETMAPPLPPPAPLPPAPTSQPSLTTATTHIHNMHHLHYVQPGASTAGFTDRTNSYISQQHQQTASAANHHFFQHSAPIKHSSSATANTTTSMLTTRSKEQSNSSFWDHYEYLCTLSNTTPLQSVKASLTVDAGSVLRLNVDRLKLSDWEPLLAAISANKTLRVISLNSNYDIDCVADLSSAKIAKPFKQQQQASKLKKAPAIRSKQVCNKLCKALKDCLSVSHHLQELELFKILLNSKDLAHIAKVI
jgi:hypothetical protein